MSPDYTISAAQPHVCTGRQKTPHIRSTPPRRKRSHGPHGWVLPVATITTVSVLAACSSSSRSIPSSSPSATATLNATQTAILHAYRAGSTAYVAAVQIPDPVYPALAATTTNPLLTQARQTLVYDKEQGIVGRGTVNLLHPHVVSYTAATAVVQDCVYSSLISVYASTGQPVPNQPGGTQPEYDGVKATLTFTSGVWKVSDQTLIAGSCPAGY
jgi:hypothetical protein